MENQSTYRVRTKLGETEPINIPISLMQEYNSFEILSLKMNVDENYNSYTSTEGIVVGRVSTANNGLGIPNVRVSIFVPKGQYSQTDEEEVLYPFSSPNDKDGDRVRYNLLPSESDVDCYQVIGTLPTKRKVLDNETVCEVFEKYYKYTTVTNEAGDFMLTNIPVGKQRIHIDADLSDIGPFLSQRPYDMIENLGFDKNKFDSTRQFKTSKDLDSLAQVISQTKSVYVYPYWGDVTEHSSDLKITRTDLSLNYEFKTSAIFIGSIITDKQSNSIRQNCTATNDAGKMSDMITGAGRIEMIRKTVDDKIEQYRIKGDMLINDNGVWCYMIPMNLDYVRTDEYGNIIPTDDPNKGVPTRARVRFRITLNQMDSDEDAHKRCSYLVPNNPKTTDEKFLKENDADYSFGSDTWDESFVDLFWNKVYSVKSYVPQIQKTTRPTNRKHTGVKMVNHYGDNNPFPYNGLTIKLNFTYRLICVLIKVIIYVITGINAIISVLGALPCWLANLKILWVRPFKFVMKFVPGCIKLSSEFCDDGINKNVYYPGCIACLWTEEAKPECEKEQAELAAKGGEAAVCTHSSSELMTCIENELAQQNECTSFNFSNDWINGCLYMPLWYRHIRPKKSFFFGLFKSSAKDQWCSSDSTFESLRLAKFCAHSNTRDVPNENYSGKDVHYKITQKSDDCGDSCNKSKTMVSLFNGVIVNRENLYGQKVWYYKSVEATASKSNYASEYLNSNGNPMTIKLLYATDIILLGSMNDCDTNGIPKFYNYLKASSFNLPTDILFSDTEFQFTSDENGNWVSTSTHKTSVASGCDWGNENEYGYEDGGLFYDIGCSEINVNTPSCINLRRICELGVGLDEMQYIENINTNISSETDSLDLNNLEYYLRPDGFMSYDDIIDFNYRSMFATMNGNHLKTKMNKTTGVKEYDFRHLYIDNFDGSLYGFMSTRQGGEPNANYRNNYNLETTSKDYLTFRMGENPYYYDGGNLAGGEYNGNAYSFPKYENSFYFYFGLKEGKTAIDLFNEQYNGPCSTKSEEEETIDYSKEPNSWCCVDSDDNGSYNHKTYDGYITFNLEDIPLPCSMMFNSKTNTSVTYTVCVLDDKGDVNMSDTNVSDENICIHGDNTTSTNINNHKRYGLKYENSSISDEPKECYMLTNGEYILAITDGEGNQHSYVINLKGKYLEFDSEERSFGQANNVLTKYYQTTGGKYSASPYNSVAKSPLDNKKNMSVELDENNIPVVSRIDEDRSLINGNDKNNSINMKLNGTICIYNVYYNNAKLDNFIIEVEPYDKDEDGNYTDEDFWKSDTQKNKTWYEVKLLVLNGNDGECCTIEEKNGKKYVKRDGGEANYFRTLKYKEEKNAYYVVKCPKGGVDYRVTVTQLCEDGSGGYFKSNNNYEKKINVAEPTPYKLYINDVDYDLIRNFNTGYVLSTGSKLQYTENEGPTPFNSFGTGNENSNFSKIKGWLQISNLQNPYYDWAVNESKYGPNSIDDYTNEMASKLKTDVSELESLKSQLDKLDTESAEYKPLKEKYDKIMSEWSGATYDSLTSDLEYVNNRLDAIDDVKSGFWIQCENDEKSITYSVRTDDTPYHVWTVYNEEQVSTSDEDYNETKSAENVKERFKWKCTGGNVTTISGIKIPTITSYDSSEFGIENDITRQKMAQTYDNDKTMCFAQDNIAANSTDSGSISIKPPYLVACVNKEGITKPDNLKKGIFFDKTTNKYNVTTYEFGEVENNQGYLRYVVDGKSYEFFGYHLIDKKFAPNIVCWSYISNVPYYLPWFEYNAEQSDVCPVGYSIKTDGILSGNINNGVSSSVDDNTGCINDFEEANIFSKETDVKTYDGDTEDSIPTRRCILYNGALKTSDNESDYNLTYTNYRHTSKVKTTVDGKEVVYIDQYRTVPNRQGTLSFSDGSCETTRDLYGSMRVRVLSTTVNQFTLSGLIAALFNTGSGESVDKTLTLRVNCTNGDTNKDIKYYIFRASQRQNLSGQQYSNNVCWYPLNAFIPKSDKDKGSVKYSLDCGCDGTDETKWVWDGSKENAAHLFNKNTNESIFRDQTHLTDGDEGNKDLADKSVKSQISYEDSDGNTQYTDTYGYGTTGVFTDLKHLPYFVVAVTENNCRAISPVYDFHMVYYIVGLIDGTNSKGETQHYLRTALVYVLRGKEYATDSSEIDSDQKYGVSNDFNGYCKKPRNYYLTQYDYTVNYTFTNGSTTVSSGDITFEKDTVQFVNRLLDLDNIESYGKSYSEQDKQDGTKYKLYSNIGGTLNKGETDPTTTPPATGTQINVGDYYYVYDGTKDDSGKYNYTYGVVKSIGDEDDEGKITTEETSTQPTRGDLIKGGVSYYVAYTKTTQDESGQDVKTTYYVNYSYNLYSIETVTYNPRIPYFMRTTDKALTDDEYESMKSLVNKGRLGFSYSGQYYVTDVTGLKHNCWCYGVIGKDDWAKWMQVPS
jgi:hypothetical protein